MDVFFPNLALTNPLELNGVLLEPADRRSVAGGIVRQTSSREAESLSAYLVWAAYRAGEDIACGKFTKTAAGKPYTEPGGKKPVNIETLLPFMPDLPEIAVYWFARYLQADSVRTRLLSLYNGLGSMPGGFEAIIRLFEAAGEAELGHSLLREVASLRSEEDDTGPSVYKCGFEEADIKRVENVFFACEKC